jgi:plastocyanin
MVTWINEDPMIHHVVHLPEVNHPELFDSGPLTSGQNFSYTFGEKGRYTYADPQIGGGRSYLIIVE